MTPELQQIVDICSTVDGKITNLQSQVSDLQSQLAAVPTPPPLQPIGILDELQALTGTTEATGWIQPGNAGNTGGASPKPHGIYTLTPGTEATFTIKPVGAYDNYYWYTKRKDNQYDPARRFLLDLSIQFPSAADLAASQGVEFEIQHSVGGWIWDMAWQVEQPGLHGDLRIFDKFARQWITTGAVLPPATWSPGKFVRITASFLRFTELLTYQSLLIDGKEYLPVPIQTPAWQATQGNYLSVGYQMDTNGSGTAYTTKVQRMRVTWSN